MHKILNPCKKKTYGGRVYNVFCEVDTEWGYLSICGVEGPLLSGNCLGACGQLIMHLKEEKEIPQLTKGWTPEIWEKFLDVWDLWQLEPIPNIPEDILTWLESLPESHIMPAWC
jgi:hypothetical protein